MTKIFIYRDKEGASRIWQNNFLKISKQMGIPTVGIAFDNLLGRPRSPAAILRSIRKRYQPGDKFVARFNERREANFKPLYAAVEQIFGKCNIFPDRLAVELYNNKRLQADFFRDKDYPTPAQRWVRGEAELERFMQAHDLSFPIVRKESRGAASIGVSLIEGPKTGYPFVAQEFCAHNPGDMRIMVVGHKIFGFTRTNRPGDFRASGSGNVEFIDDLPLPCVQAAYRISRECGFICMAYDFIKNNRGQWVCVEISYTFVSEPPSLCRYYYDARRGFARIDRPVGMVERLILDRMVAAEE